MGVGVASRRYLYTLVGGALAGVGGAYLSLGYTPTWVEGMTAGRGWIAIGLVVFGTWDPLAGDGRARICSASSTASSCARRASAAPSRRFS